MTRLPVLIVGAGNAARLWLGPALATPEVQLVAVVDQVPERARALLAGHAVDLPVRSSLDAALDELSPSLVVDLTPPGSRWSVAAPAFAAGCDVITEKPLAETVAGAGMLIELAECHGRRLAVMQNRRSHPAMRALRELAGSGRLGELTLVSCDLHRTVAALDRLAAHPAPLLSDMAIHEFDQARYLIGAQPQRVMAAQTGVPGSGWAGATVTACTSSSPAASCSATAAPGLRPASSRPGSDGGGWTAARRPQSGTATARSTSSDWPGIRPTARSLGVSRCPWRATLMTIRRRCQRCCVRWPRAARWRPTPATTSPAWPMVEAAMESAGSGAWVEVEDVLSRATRSVPPASR